MRVVHITNMVSGTNNKRNNAENNKTKKENKDDIVDSTKKDSNISLSNSLFTESDNDKEKEELSYYEKQVLKELKGIKKASKNILKSLKKSSS